MLIKLTAGASLLCSVLALLVVARGWTDEIEGVIGPGGGLKKGTPEYAATPVAKANGAAAKSNIAILMRDAEFDLAGGDDRTNQAEISADLKETEPGMPVGQSIESGGIAVSVADEGQTVVLCARPAYYYCGAVSIPTRQSGTGEGKTVDAAKSVALQGAHGQQAASQTPITGTTGDPENQGQGLATEILGRAQDIQVP